MEGEREVTGSSIFTRTCRAPNCTVWDKGFQLSPGKELRPQTSFPFVAAIMPSVWGQRCPRPSRGGRSPASLSVLAKVQRASCPPAGGRGCVWGGIFSNPSFHSRAAVPGGCCWSIRRGWKRWAEGHWESGRGRGRAHLLRTEKARQ